MAKATKSKLASRARDQREHLLYVANRIVVRSAFLLRERGWDADRIAKLLGLMQGAAEQAVVTDAGTNADIDGKTGEFTAESLDRTIEVDLYAGYLADEMCKEVSDA
jgi:hypothetical protein